MTGDVNWAVSDGVMILLLLAAAGVVFLVVVRLRSRRQRSGMERAERELSEARRALESLRGNTEGFLDLATHELRSPLSAILGYQELLADGAYGELDEPMAEAIERIGRSARHLLHLIDGLVELSRIRSGTLRPDVETVNLGVLLSSVADAFRTAARDRGLEPHVEMPPALPSIRSDQTRLLRAFDLLITSAVKYPAGRDIAFRVSVAGDRITTRIDGTELTPGHPAEDLAVRLGIRLAVVDGMARVLGGALVLEEGDNGVVRALSLRVRDLESGPAL